MSISNKHLDLSIVIIGWNTIDLLRDCLQSVLENIDGIHTEVIVVDNASADGSAEMVAAAFPSVHMIRNSVNRGFAAANNQAMSQARGRYVLLLNSDTIVLGDVLRRAVHFMDRNGSVGVLGCQVLNTDRTIQHTCFRDPDLRSLTLVASGLHRLPWPRFLGGHIYRGWDRCTSRNVDVVTGCFMCVRQSAIKDVGMFDERFFFYAEEADWCRRFRDARWDVRFEPVGQIVHHGGASAMQLDDRRTVLLGDALIRLLHKRRGQRAAAIAWLLLLSFNTSRCVIWALLGLATLNRDVLWHAKRFGRAAGRFGANWPGKRFLAQKDIRKGTYSEVRATPRRYFRSQACRLADAPSMADVERKMTSSTRRRVLAVASGGGHWVQLLRLRPALANQDVTYVTVNRAARDQIGSERLYVVPDATRWTKVRLIVLMIKMFFIVIRTRPEVVISTGAAPGYFGVLFGKMFGAQTLWIDSIANVEHLSLSGKKARRIADTTLTQWQHLADEDSGLVYAGAVV